MYNALSNHISSLQNNEVIPLTVLCLNCSRQARNLDTATGMLKVYEILLSTDHVLKSQANYF